MELKRFFQFSFYRFIEVKSFVNIRRDSAVFIHNFGIVDLIFDNFAKICKNCYL